METIGDLESLICSLQLQFWSAVGVSALLIYDILITLDEEINYFWVSPLNSTNLIFFLMRYGAVIRSIVGVVQSKQVLKVYGTVLVWLASLLDWIIILCMDYILYLRVRALHFFEAQCKRVVLSIQLLYFFNAVVTLSSLITLFQKEQNYSHTILGDASFCDAKRSLVGLRCLYWSAPLLYDSILMSLALIKAMHIRKSLGFRGMELVRVLVFDQAVYFTLIIAVSVVNITTTAYSTQEEPAFAFVIYTIGSAELLSLQGSRMLIRLKKVAKRKAETGATLRFMSNASDPEFRTYAVDESHHSIQYSWALGD